MNEPSMAGAGRPGEPRTPPAGIRAVVGTLLAVVVGGALTGAVIALVTAPASEVALPICAFAPPLAFGLGLTAWRSLLGSWLLATLGRSLLRSRGDEARFREEAVRSLRSVRDAGPSGLPFTWVFVPVALGVGTVAAILLLLFDGTAATTTAVLLVAATTAYGIVVRSLARAGRLPLPEG